MWEAIRANRRRSRILIGLMGALLVLAGAAFGAVYDPQNGMAIGAILALGVWLVLLVTALTGGTQVMLAGTGARKIKKEEAPRLWNVVEEMVIASGLGKMPDVYVIDDEAPNAFAVGQKPEVAAVAVTTGLLRRLNRDELQGVVAHEIGHIKNLDVRFLTIAGVMLGAIVVLAEIFLRSLWYTGGRRRVGGSRGGGQAQIILVLFAVAVAILAPLAAPMYIVNPLQSPRLTGLFSTHPPTEKRIRILQGMAGASWADYEAAYRDAHGAGATALLDRGVLGSDPEPVPIRAATPDPDGRQAAGETAREVVDLLDRTLGLLLIPCACGVRIKVPSDLDRDRVPCPRCGREHAVPSARPAAAESPGGERPEGEVLRFQRSGKDWESFRCACGRALEVSPAFRAGTMTCPGCKRRISVT